MSFLSVIVFHCSFLITLSILLLISSICKICKVSYSFGERVDAHTAILINDMQSAYQPMYFSGFFLYSFLSSAKLNFLPFSFIAENQLFSSMLRVLCKSETKSRRKEEITSLSINSEKGRGTFNFLS